MTLTNKNIEGITEEVFTKIVGTTYRKHVPWHLMHKGIILIPEREPLGTEEEPHDDPNAIALYALLPIGKIKIGYIARQIAEDIAPQMDEGILGLGVEITALTGDWEGNSGKNKGINIKLSVNHIDITKLTALNPFQ